MFSFISAIRANLIFGPISLILSLVASIAIARQLGPESFADYATILAFVSWGLLLFEAGGNTGFARFLNEAGRSRARLTLYNSLLLWRRILGLLVIVTLAIIGPYWVTGTGLSSDRWSITLFILIGLLVALGLQSQLAYYGLLGSFAHRKLLFYNQLFTILRAAGICLMVLFVTKSPIALATVLLAVACLETIVFNRQAMRIFVKEHEPLKTGMFLATLRHGLVAVFDKITTSMGGGAFLLIVLAGYYDRSELAMLGVATDLLQKSLLIPGFLVSNLVMPLLNVRRDRPKEYLTTVARLVTISSLLFFSVLGGVVLSLPLGLPLLYGEAYREAVILGMWFVVPLFFEAWVRMTAGSALLTLDRYRMIIGLNIATLFFVVVSLVFTYDLGLTLIVIMQGVVRIIMSVMILIFSSSSGLFRLAWLPWRALALVCLAYIIGYSAATLIYLVTHPIIQISIALLTYVAILLGFMRWVLELDREFVEAIQRLAGRHSAQVKRFVRVKAL